MINLCNHDHTLHHDGQLAITGNPEGTITFTHTDGRQVHSPARFIPSKTRPKPTPMAKHANPSQQNDQQHNDLPHNDLRHNDQHENEWRQNEVRQEAG